MEERYHQILDTAIRLFNEYGIRSVTMDDICEQLGISKKTMYQVFKCKDDLVDLMLEHRTRQVEAIFESAGTQPVNAIDRLVLAGRQLAEFFKTNRANPSVEYDLKKYYPALYKKHSDQLGKLVQKALTDNLNQGIQEELYRKDLNPELIANFFLKKLELISETDPLNEMGLSFKKLFRLMLEYHLRGISTKKGIKYYEKHNGK
jgi:AcrR family transcriptional regulator